MKRSYSVRQIWRKKLIVQNIHDYFRMKWSNLNLFAPRISIMQANFSVKRGDGGEGIGHVHNMTQ